LKSELMQIYFFMIRILFVLMLFSVFISCHKDDAEYIVRTDITISEPRKGAVLEKGKSYTIAWQTTKADAVRLDLFRADKQVSIISVSEPNNGIFNWKVPHNILPDSTFRIRITSTSNTGVSSFSHFFSISGDSVQKFISFDVMENISLIKGNPFSIQWQTNIEEDVKIELLQHQSPVQVISESAKSNEPFDWTIASTLPTHSFYRFKISSTLYPDLYALSNFFRISVNSTKNILANSNFSGANTWNYSNPDTDSKNRWNINTVNGEGGAEVISLMSSGDIFQNIDLQKGNGYRIEFTLTRCNGFFGAFHTSRAGIVFFLGENESNVIRTEGSHTVYVKSDGLNKAGFRIITDPVMAPNSGFICKVNRVELYDAGIFQEQ
jgi:hypothetical protein